MVLAEFDAAAPFLHQKREYAAATASFDKDVEIWRSGLTETDRNT